jgi:hypothetical protein
VFCRGPCMSRLVEGSPRSSRNLLQVLHAEEHGFDVFVGDAYTAFSKPFFERHNIRRVRIRGMARVA